MSETPAAAWMHGDDGGPLYRNGHLGTGYDFALRVFPWAPSICYERRSELATLFRGSSAVEHPTVNRMVVGSNPTRGATSDHQKTTQKIGNTAHFPILAVRAGSAHDLCHRTCHESRHIAADAAILLALTTAARDCPPGVTIVDGEALRVVSCAMMACRPQWPLILMIGRSSRLLARSWAD